LEKRLHSDSAGSVGEECELVEIFASLGFILLLRDEAHEDCAL
jgi:hypothetical protein